MMFGYFWRVLLYEYCNSIYNQFTGHNRNNSGGEFVDVGSRRPTMKWIHISDIHYNPKADTSYTMRGRRRLPKFIEENGLKADHLFVTGDYRHAYKQRNQDEDKVAADVVDYIISIADAASIPRENIHLIPGNHDLKRIDKKERPADFKKLEKIRQSYLEDPEVFDDDDMKFLDAPFSFFSKVCKRLRSKVPQIDIPWLDEDIMPSIIGRPYDEFSLICINTCLFCHSDDARKKLVIDIGLLYRVAADLEEKNPGKPIVFLAHHGFSELDNEVEKQLEDVFGDIKEETIYLCGDAHDLWIRSINHTIEITTGCLVDGKNVKTLISMGECTNNSFQSIKGFNCERGYWASYPLFDQEIKKHLENRKAII